MPVQASRNFAMCHTVLLVHFRLLCKVYVTFFYENCLLIKGSVNTVCF